MDLIRFALTNEGTLRYQDVLEELRQRMSDFGGITRNRAEIANEVPKAWELWRRLNSDIRKVEPAELPEALRTFDLCLTHAVYLEAISEYLNRSDNEDFIKNNILEVRLDDQLKLHKQWVPVRPIPREELWFEKVWKDSLKR
jgi:hypothetical protein